MMRGSKSFLLLQSATAWTTKAGQTSCRLRGMFVSRNANGRCIQTEQIFIFLHPAHGDRIGKTDRLIQINV